MTAAKLQNEHFKILILIKGLGLGGAERLIVDSLPYLNREQFDYEFAYMLPWKDFLVPTITKAGFPVHCLDMQKIWHFPMVQRRLQNLIRERNFDLIHADLPVTGVLARLMGRRFGIPVIYTEHNLQERYHPLTRRANALTFGWNDCVLGVSEEVTASIDRSGLGRKTKVKTLLNGVPVEQVKAEAGNVNGLREEFGIPRSNLVVGTVAVFRRQKRLQDWLEVASRVTQQQKNVTFLLVGHGPEEPHLRAKIKELNLGERIVIPGFRPDGRRVMALMDVFFMTSEFEGLPMALLEAMALAKPVVATAVGGIPEVVKNGDEGFLTSVGAVDELAGCIAQLLADPQLRQRMGERGAAKVEEKFHIKHRVKFIEALYWEILAKRGRTTSPAIKTAGSSSIQHASSFQNFAYERGINALPSLDLGARMHENIDGGRYTSQGTISTSCPFGRCFIALGYNHEQVDIAVFSRLPPHLRSKEQNFFRI